MINLNNYKCLKYFSPKILVQIESSRKRITKTIKLARLMNKKKLLFAREQ